ncbi:NAD-dependent epimerase/dehydratase family protein [Devosia rhizoryzae]|uniref:NAD-dependent epimerase/dehydratase family protein n=1 Tax=Devosia rhizoryzae TaxID=2774137 RepID=A0ABX7C326_9HYPH|nr:NAD-dependent epimerase/dehydratase family protein [Devosia rhizoryzae]QQR38626.1 NAD-dependent epimerase/dehydratase family protein [Devosia rhizoryzae]
MSVAVLGGTGFIGSAIVRQLTARGLQPVAIARGQHPLDLPEGALFQAADRMDSQKLAAIFDEHGITTVIDIFALGMLNTTPVLAALGDAGRRYVLLSSVDVYSNYGGLLRREEPAVQPHPAAETDPLRSFRYPYRGNSRRPKGVDDALFDDYDKIIIEETALSDPRFSTTVIRAPMIFGPGDKQHRFAWAIEAVRAGGTIRVDERAAHWPNSYGYVTDVADAIVVTALDPRAAERIYNVGQSFVRTPVEWLHRFAEVMGASIDIEIVPASERGLLWERAEASDLRYPLTLDTSRIRAELGFAEPTAEDEALHKTIAAGG